MIIGNGKMRNLFFYGLLTEYSDDVRHPTLVQIVYSGGVFPDTFLPGSL